MSPPGTHGSPRCRARTRGALRNRNGEMAELIRRQSTGHRWSLGWHRGEAGVREDPGAHVYDVHPDLSETWLELRPLSA